MSDRAEDLNEWRSEQYAKNAKSYEPKVWLTADKKFPPALGAIVDQALKDKSAWIGKTVQDLTCEAIRKRGLSQEDEGCICLTIEEACEILDYLSYLHLRGGRDSFLKDLEKCNRNLYERIEKAEKCNE